MILVQIALLLTLLMESIINPTGLTGKLYYTGGIYDNSINR
jgi:hypothetical protein